MRRHRGPDRGLARWVRVRTACTAPPVVDQTALMQPDDTYTHGHDESVLRSHVWRTVENSAAYAAPYFRPGVDVLDVGCGPGTITSDIAGRVAPGPRRRHRPQRRGHRCGAWAWPTASTACGSRPATSTPSTTPTTASTSCTPTRCCSTSRIPIRALREMRRVCRPGGVVAARDADYASFAWAPLDDRLDDWLATYRSVTRANGGEPDAGRHLLGWAHAAGFGDVRASASVWCFATPDERAWWGGLWADRMRDSSVSRPGPGRRARHPGAARRDGRRLRSVGPAPRCLVRRPPRRDPRPRRDGGAPRHLGAERLKLRLGAARLEYGILRAQIRRFVAGRGAVAAILDIPPWRWPARSARLAACDWIRSTTFVASTASRHVDRSTR